MKGEQHRERERREVPEDHRESLRIVDVLGTVKRRQHEPAGCDLIALQQRLPIRRKETPDGLDDRVAGEEHPVAGDTFSGQIVDVDPGRCRAQVRQVIGDDPVVFLRHVAVSAPEAGLDVNEGNPPGVRCERACGDSVGVALYDDGEGAVLGEVSIEELGCITDLVSSGGASHPQVQIGFGKVQLAEERRREVGVVVLTGVNHPSSVAEQPDDMTQLDDLGPCAEHDGDGLRWCGVVCDHGTLPAMVRALSIAAQLVVLAFVLYTLSTSLWGLPSQEPAPHGGRKRRFRVVVPAHDEQAVIRNVLGDLKAQRYPAELVRIVVLADRCTDRTVDLASGRAEVVERQDGPDGKGALLAWYLARQPLDADEAIVVVDADNRVDDDLLSRFADELDRGHQALQGYLDVANPDASALAAASALSYWASNRMVQLARDRLGWGAELGGTGMCLTAAALERGGGFEASGTEDQALTARLLLAGIRVHWLHDVRVSDEKPEKLGVMVRQRTRWSGGKRLVGRSVTGSLLGLWLKEGSMAAFDLALRINQPGRSMVAAMSGVLTIVAAVWPSRYLLAWWIWAIATILQVGAPMMFLARDEVPKRYLWRYPYLVVFAALSPVARLLSRRTTGWYHTPHRG